MRNRHDAVIANRVRGSLAVAWIGVVSCLVAGLAQAQVAGAIFTTTKHGTKVDANLYDTKQDVYLNGGPQNQNDPGLTDGLYYFQVTNPSGSLLLSSEGIGCREVQMTGRRIVGPVGVCQHAAINNLAVLLTP